MKRTGLGFMGFQFYYDLGSDIPSPNKLEVSAAFGTHLHCSLTLPKTSNAAFSQSNSALISFPLVVAIRGIAALP